MNFSIIIPVYNEINYIPKILKKLFNLKIKKNIKLIIVDDSSTDGTKNWLKSDKPKKLLNNYKNKKNNFIMKIILKKKNEGKGSAIIEGLKYTKENDVILIQDADLEYNPNDIPKLLKLIENGNDVVFGNRFHFNNHYHYKIFAIANYIISSFTSIIFFYKISDTAACYKIFKRRILKNLITLKEKDFMFDFEFTSKVLKKKKYLRISETNISYKGRTFDEGKKISWKDGFRALYTILKVRIFY